MLEPFSRLTLMARLRVESGRLGQNDAGRVDELDGFTTLDLKASHNLLPSLSLEAGLSNLFDASYVLTEGYPEPGRSLFVNLRYRWSKPS